MTPFWLTIQIFLGITVGFFILTIPLAIIKAMMEADTHRKVHEANRRLRKENNELKNQITILRQ